MCQQNLTVLYVESHLPFQVVYNSIEESILSKNYFSVSLLGVKKQYKWRQDLHQHVQKYLKSFACELCGFVTDEKHLLRCHKIKHKDIFNYTCTPCDF